MDQQQAVQILKPLMWKVGKSNGEQLWMHQFTVWHVFRQMSDIGAFPALEKEKRELLELACLLHDVKKSTPWNQMVISGETDADTLLGTYLSWWHGKGVSIDAREKVAVKALFSRGRTDHQIETERDLEFFLKDYLNRVKASIPFELNDGRIRTVFDLIKHHFLKEEDISTSDVPGFGSNLYTLKLCDRLASMESIDPAVIHELRNINRLGRRIFDVTYFTISRPFGPFTALVSDVVFESYRQCGWQPLLYFEGGGVLVGKGETELPDKTAILKKLNEQFLEKSLDAAPLQFGRKSVLEGMAGDYVHTFLKVKKDELLRKFNEADGGIAFFKLLTEIVDRCGYNTRTEREKRPALDVLFGLTGGTRGIPLAGPKWEHYRNEHLPYKADGSGKVDKQGAISHVFNCLNIQEAIPEKLFEELNIADAPLKDCTSRVLFDVLAGLAVQYEREGEAALQTYFDEIISIEEEKNFRSITLNRFEQYKAYKRNPSDTTTGVCEICGCTITQKPGADFAKGQIQAFTQIKARPDVPRKICPFCAYDNSIMRQGVGKWIPVYVKVYTKVPMIFREEITEIIKVLKDGIIRLQNIESMEKRWGLLFPSVDIPVASSDYDVLEYVATSDRGEMILRLESVDAKKYSPKDMQAKYEPLYHLLNLLGFRVSIGREEQVGLFGETILGTESDYLKSLAVVLLSSAVDKMRKYLFAKDLIAKSPSVAVAYAGQEEKDRKGNSYFRLSDESAEKFFEYIYTSNINLFRLNGGGGYLMKNLLEDAVFFAEGIPKFCWRFDDEWKKWHQSSSKHLITKPLSRALNEILQGRSFDEAFAKFLEQLRENIAKEQSDEAKTDVTELNAFVKEAKSKLEKYYELKQKNITEFIRVKNALLSTVYVFKRYDNLKEVIQ